MGQFGIGVYGPIPGTGETIVGTGRYHPNDTYAPLIPYSGAYGGQYGFLLYTDIRSPQRVSYMPPQSIGLDATGVPVVRGYGQLLWTYSTLRPDYWYYFQRLYTLAGYTPPGFEYIVVLQYPDPLQNGAIVQQTARWDPPTSGGRDVGAFHDISLHFSYVGQAQLTNGTPVQIVT